jgi:hypothetical protein
MKQRLEHSIANSKRKSKPIRPHQKQSTQSKGFVQNQQEARFWTDRLDIGEDYSALPFKSQLFVKRRFAAFKHQLLSQ